MNSELKFHPVQEDLFPNEPTPSKPDRPTKYDEDVVDVDHVNHVARIMEYGYVLKCVLREGKIRISGVEGATSLKDVPLPVQARAIKKAWAILGPEAKS
jgi:hypothetical protein